MKSGIRRKRSTQPTMDPNGPASSIIKYSTLGSTLVSDTNGEAWHTRIFIPGNATALTVPIGPSVVSYYSTAKFLPGTRLRWEPSVSFTISGRVYVAFTDNPEVIADVAALTGTSFGNAVKGMGSVVSFPVWQETDIPFPTRTRRKMFDVNETILTNVDVLDRSAQTAVFVHVDGTPANTRAGSMWYHDEVLVEGMHPRAT